MPVTFASVYSSISHLYSYCCVFDTSTNMINVKFIRKNFCYVRNFPDFWPSAYGKSLIEISMMYMCISACRPKSDLVIFRPISPCSRGVLLWEHFNYFRVVCVREYKRTQFDSGFMHIFQKHSQTGKLLCITNAYRLMWSSMNYLREKPRNCRSSTGPFSPKLS